jgi:hypothetical protein
MTMDSSSRLQGNYRVEFAVLMAQKFNRLRFSVGRSDVPCDVLTLLTNCVQMKLVDTSNLYEDVCTDLPVGYVDIVAVFQQKVEHVRGQLKDGVEHDRYTVLNTNTNNLLSESCAL